MKKLLSMMLASAMIAASVSIPAMAEEAEVALIEEPVVTSVAEEAPIAVMLDGEFIEFDVQPAMINDRTMVPVRAIFEALGATVDWVEETETVVSKLGETEISLKINDKILTKNGEAIELDVPAQLVGTRTLVPVRAISEAYGCYVSWNQWNNTVIITSDLNKTAIATVNDEAITVGYFNFVLSQVEAYAMQSFNCSAEDLKNIWNSSLGTTGFGEYMATTTLEQCIYTKANAQQAKAQGMEFTLADKQSVEAELNAFKEIYADTYDEYMAMTGTTWEAMEEFYNDNKYAEKYYNALMKEGEMSEKEIEKYLDDNYVRAKHILFATVNTSTGMPLSEEEVAAKKALAEDTLAKIKKGADFDKLMTELGEDPGTAAYPDGYLFTKGEMVEPFEKAAYALKVNKVSGIVESSYGYHIIKRVDNGEYTEQELAMVRSALVDNKVSSTMNANKSDAVITSNSNMIINTVPVGIE